MSTHYTAIQLGDHLRTVTALLRETARQIPAQDFFEPRGEKWPAAGHIRHLILTARATRLAYRLPAWALKIYTGRPNRPGRSYEELVSRYQARLAAGGRAPSRFVPATENREDNPELLLRNLTGETENLCRLIGQCTEQKLDNCLAPHPLLGKITLRELGYFTCYHHEHHRRLLIRDYPGLTGSFTAS